MPTAQGISKPADNLREALPRPRGAFWVFGYGSLMWRPEFTAQQTVAASLYGYHRRLCLWSMHYRGTPSKPGLVLGLARGGSCRGLALRVSRSDSQTVLNYLYEREMINNLYRPAIKNIYLPCGRTVKALTFLAKPEHPQFAGFMSVPEIVKITRAAAGKHGNNYEYVINTARHLTELGIEGTEVHSVAQNLQSISARG